LESEHTMRERMTTREKTSAGWRAAWTLLVGLAVGASACKPSVAPQPAPAPEPAAPERIEVERLRAHLAFLADDAQEGRAPGTDADGRVQTYVEQIMREAGLEPLFADSYRQRFEVTDGVRIQQDGEVRLDVSGLPVATQVLPFSADTSRAGPVVAKLVFVGHGIPRGAPWTGDYEGLEKKIEGNIVVALHGGPDDPHLSPAALRAQSKLIAARDHGAAGFVLWDPAGAIVFPNHGTVNDLGLAAVAVGSEGTPALLEALTGKRAAAASVEAAVAKLPAGKTTQKRATLQTDVQPVTLETANVAGRLRGNGETNKILVVGAHMDHLGLGTAHSLAPGEEAVHNGADDNASGVAVMLEVCGTLAQVPASRRPYDVVCIAFGAEEMGLLGSKHYVATASPKERARIVAMINFDMVGRLGADGLVVAGAGTSSIWPKLVEQTRGALVVKTTEDGHGPSDHGSFYEQKIPVLHFFTGPHEDYHKPSDDIDKINFDGAAQVGTMAYALARTLLAEKLEPDYLETEARQPRAGGFRVSLGTIPDYAAKVDGVRLSGVRKGGPAETAGLRQGDVIRQLGEREIHNLDDYMAAFAAMKPGQPVRVVVDREGETVELELVPGAPSSPSP
jgi:aminopeptidase YwaD